MTIVAVIVSVLLAGCVFPVHYGRQSDSVAIVPMVAGTSEENNNASLMTEEETEPGKTDEQSAFRNEPPIPSFRTKPFSRYRIGMNIVFDAAEFSDPEGHELVYLWNFGDESPRFGPTAHNPVSHTYFRPGEYRVTLTVIDITGASSSITFPIAVSEN